MSNASNPHKYFLLSNIFRASAVLLLIATVLMAAFLPVFKVEVKGIPTVEFSIMDVVSDISTELKLCLNEDDMDLEDMLEISENYGEFNKAVDATQAYKIAKDAEEAMEDGSLDNMISSITESRFVTLLPYLALLLPLILVITTGITSIIRLISVILGFIKPSTQIKKNDSASALVLAGFVALCYFLSLLYGCFSLNFVWMGLLIGAAVGSLVMDIVYKSHTKSIVNAQFGM